MYVCRRWLIVRRRGRIFAWVLRSATVPTTTRSLEISISIASSPARRSGWHHGTNVVIVYIISTIVPRYVDLYSRSDVTLYWREGGDEAAGWSNVIGRRNVKCEAVFIDRSTCISYCSKPHMQNMHHTFSQSVTRVVKKYNVTRNRIRTYVQRMSLSWTDRDAVWVVDSGGPMEACITWGHIGATCRIRLNRPCAAAMRPYVKLF